MAALLGAANARLASPPRTALAKPPTDRRPRNEIWGFTAPWDPRSAESVKRHGSQLTAVVTGWVRLDTVTTMPAPAYPDTLHVPPGPRRFALVTTYARDRFHAETIRRLADDTALRTRVSDTLAAWARRSGYAGLVLDFEGLTRDDTLALDTVVTAFARAAHARRIRPVSVTVVPTDTVVYAARHLRGADLVLPMLYDQHWATGAPGPIADPLWFRQALISRVAEAGANRLVAGLPLYGYLWKTGSATTVLSYGDAQRAAATSGLGLSRDSLSSTLHFVSPDSAQAWVTDAALLRTLERTADSLGVHRFALWRLGLEDEGMWKAR
jgi:spore germination protein YaaH